VPTDEGCEATELADDTLRALGGLALADRGGCADDRSETDAVGDIIGERQAEESIEGRAMGREEVRL
jgi:hypothetical protein